MILVLGHRGRRLLDGGGDVSNVVRKVCVRKLRGGRAALAVPRAVGGAGDTTGDMAGDSGQARLAREVEAYTCRMVNWS